LIPKNVKWKSRLTEETNWANNIVNAEAKQAVALDIAKNARNGETIGAGSGSTSLLTLIAIAKRVKEEHLKIKIIPTSIETMMTCSQMGIPLTTIVTDKPNWAFDGADEVDPAHNLINGRGGAFFNEKLLIRTSPKNIILIDNSKQVKRLGEKFPVPIEVYPPSISYVESALAKLGLTGLTLRPAKGKDGPVITENGNLILDCHFEEIQMDLELQIKSITGVIESGLFWNYSVEVIVAPSP
jgi:ribose 5-phosphate isomerase A